MLLENTFEALGGQATLRPPSPSTRQTEEAGQEIWGSIVFVLFKHN